MQKAHVLVYQWEMGLRVWQSFTEKAKEADVMREWKRILLSPVWLVTLFLLVVCHTGLYLYSQIEFAGGSLSSYSRETIRWQDRLAQMPLETALSQLEQEINDAEGWQAAWEYVHGGYMDESWADILRESDPGFDEKVHAIEQGEQVEDSQAVINAMHQWQRRLHYQEGYADNINAVVQQAKLIRSNPVFAEEGSFAYRNAVQTEEDYAAIADITMTPVSDDIINSFLHDRSALVFSLCLMAVTVVLILEPRRLGMETVERSAAGGRSLLTLWRLGAVMLAALAGTLIIQETTLAVGMIVYGQGIDLFLPVQVMEFFQSWTWRIPLWGFLLWYMTLRWAGLALAGMLFWLLLSRLKSLPFGLVACGAVLLIEYHWFTSYGVNDAGYLLAAANLFHLLFPEDLAGRYLNYSIAGYPVAERILMPLLLLLLLIFMTAVLLLTSHYARGVRSYRFLSRFFTEFTEKLRAHRRLRPLWIYESRKALLYSGGIVLLASVSAFLWTRPAPIMYQTREEAMLTQYVQLYAGEVTQQNLEEIQVMRQQADEEYANAGTSVFSGEAEYLAARSAALQVLEERYSGLLERQNTGEKGLQLIDELPLERIFGETGQTFRLVEACAVLLGLCLAVPGLFAIEQRNGMELTLRSTLHGRSDLWRCKMKLAAGMAVFLWLVWTVHELLLLHTIGLNWGSLTASGASLDYWNASLGQGPVFLTLLLFYLLRFAGLFAAAGVMLFLSARFPSLLSAGGIGAAVLLLPVLLFLAGNSWLSTLSWAITLGGTDLSIGCKSLIWMLIWTVCGIISTIASCWEWRRYHA